MEDYREYISPNRQCVLALKSLIENGEAKLGTFDVELERMKLLDCKKPVGINCEVLK